jgi:hypothetical protein
MVKIGWTRYRLFSSDGGARLHHESHAVAIWTHTPVIRGPLLRPDIIARA